MFEFILFAVILYLFYKLLFEFILPVSRVTSEMRYKMKQAHKENNQPSSAQKQTVSDFQSNIRKGKDEQYIDFEEIK